MAFTMFEVAIEDFSGDAKPEIHSGGMGIEGLKDNPSLPMWVKVWADGAKRGDKLRATSDTCHITICVIDDDESERRDWHRVVF